MKIINTAQSTCVCKGLAAQGQSAVTRVEEIEDKLIQKIRYLDKLVDVL